MNPRPLGYERANRLQEAKRTDRERLAEPVDSAGVGLSRLESARLSLDLSVGTEGADSVCAARDQPFPAHSWTKASVHQAGGLSRDGAFFDRGTILGHPMPRITTWSDLLRPGDATAFFDRVPLPEFDASLASYSPANAWWLAELSRLIYRHDIEEEPVPPEPSRSSFLATVGLRQVAFFQSLNVGTQGYLVESTGRLRFAALVFRGTEDKLRDFVTDLETYPTRVAAPDVRVHDGFEDALDEVWSSVSRELANLQCPVFYAGHSLGAALATIAASRRPPTAVYTFGSPRVGNKAFAATLRSVALYRIVDDIDVVTTLPPEELGFTHVGALYKIGTRPRAGVSLNPWHWVRRLMAPPRSLADHAPINYVRRIF